jgi:hypothetical protein
LEADWITEKLSIRIRKNGIKRKIELIPAGNDLEKLREIMSARDYM